MTLITGSAFHGDVFRSPGVYAWVRNLFFFVPRGKPLGYAKTANDSFNGQAQKAFRASRSFAGEGARAPSELSRDFHGPFHSQLADSYLQRERGIRFLVFREHDDFVITSLGQGAAKIPSILCAFN